MNQAKVSIGLVNPKSPENVGSVLRASGNFRVQSVFYTGKRYPRAQALNPDIPKMRRKVSRDVPIKGVTDLIANGPQGRAIICVEFAENACSLPDFKHPQDAYYIFGPEDGNIDQQIIDQADAVVYIPTVGCMNLSATVNVLLYDRLSKSPQQLDHPLQIRENRDTNNRLKFATRSK
jgi:tRNA(Leu) C34 or U34 (ribose-2'-O)-methylase TrmL